MNADDEVSGPAQQCSCGPETGIAAQRLVAVLRAHWPDRYAAWVEAGFSQQEIEQWYPVTLHRTTLPHAAVRMREHRITPAHFRSAVHGIGDVAGARDPEFLDAREARREAVLWEEVRDYLDHRRGIAQNLRDARLSAARRLGAKLPELAEVFGWSKQYLSQITVNPMGPRRGKRTR